MNSPEPLILLSAPKRRLLDATTIQQQSSFDRALRSLVGENVDVSVELRLEETQFESRQAGRHVGEIAVRRQFVALEQVMLENLNIHAGHGLARDAQFVVCAVALAKICTLLNPHA